jgi:dolichyl-phosphate beta-glucosyltransferase
MSGSVAIILPAFDEAARLGGALDELFAFLDDDAGLRDRTSVLVVDDGSTDGTADLVRAHPAARDPGRLAVMVVPHAGKGSAVRAGMLAADADLLVFADADMATPPDQLPRLLAALDRVDVALGSRIQPDGSDMRATQPRLRRTLGWVFHLLSAAWVSGPVRDTQCGFKGFRRAAARDVFERQRTTSIVFDVELIYLARRLGYRLEVVPIRWVDKRGSRMRPGLRLGLRVGWDLFRIPFLHRGLRRAERTA